MLPSHQLDIANMAPFSVDLFVRKTLGENWSATCYGECRGVGSDIDILLGGSVLDLVDCIGFSGNLKSYSAEAYSGGVCAVEKYVKSRVYSQRV